MRPHSTTETSFRWLPILLAAGLLALTTAPVGAAPVFEPETAETLEPATVEALEAALDDELKAAAFYRAVMDQHGELHPFDHVVHAEQRHADHLLALFARYGLEVPANRWAEHEFEIAETVKGVCEQAVEAEIENIELYDAFLVSVSQDDIQQVFTWLRDASEDRHLPAFQRCVDRDGRRAGRGMGVGRGGGCGKGAGAGCACQAGRR